MSQEYIRYLYVNMVVDNLMCILFLGFIAWGIVKIWQKVLDDDRE
jgi:TRAP-type C4-dicarboxylate transport system permease small subunit